MSFGGFDFNPFSHEKAREHHEYLESREFSASDEKPRGAPLSHESKDHFFSFTFFLCLTRLVVIAGAAAFEVMKGFEKHKEQHGKEVKHATLKVLQLLK